MLLIILLVLWVMTQFLWLLLLLGALPVPTGYAAGSAGINGWLAWFSTLILGLVVFLAGTGTVTWR